VSEEIEQIHKAVLRAGGILKVIFENDFLEDDQHRQRLCAICNAHRVAFVKTSTGYGFVKREGGMYSYEGATDRDLVLMRRECIGAIEVKAAGGIRTLDDVLRVRALGVTRVGATATEAILQEAKTRGYR
jgi:deoxyribose-phosphate aldolase